jgi:hypothetical protein
MGSECKRRADLFEPMLLGMMSALRGTLINYMQSNAPWKDRTGNARRSLNASANITGKGSVTLSAYHGVGYGGYLETGTNYNPWTGRGNQAYPIVGPALQAHYGEARKIMDILAGGG